MKNYNPDRAIDPLEWTTLDEDERHYLVERYHRKKRIKMPNVHMHAAFHVIVENQVALADEIPAQKTLERLMKEGLSRHDGIHAIGIGATLGMDLWNLFLKRVFSIPSLNYCLLGRWLLHMPEGRFRHLNITTASPKCFECQAGRIAHYAIGITLALVFVFLQSGDWLARPTFLPALLYGISTVVFPLFIMQPSFGLGIAASRTPKPAQARLKSLVTHSVFGIGLYVCALGMTYM